jgi:hypothetical protein
MLVFSTKCQISKICHVSLLAKVKIFPKIDNKQSTFKTKSDTQTLEFNNPSFEGETDRSIDFEILWLMNKGFTSLRFNYKILFRSWGLT